MYFDSVLTICKQCKKEIVVSAKYEERNKPYYCSKRCRDMDCNGITEDDLHNPDDAVNPHSR